MSIALLGRKRLNTARMPPKSLVCSELSLSHSNNVHRILEKTKFPRNFTLLMFPCFCYCETWFTCIGHFKLVHPTDWHIQISCTKVDASASQLIGCFAAIRKIHDTVLVQQSLPVFPILKIPFLIFQWWRTLYIHLFLCIDHSKERILEIPFFFSLLHHLEMSF